MIIYLKNSMITNKVSMEILNLKVVNKYWFSKLVKFKVGNLNLITVSSIENVTNFKVTSRYPSLAVNIEWVVCSCVDGFAV